MASVWDVKSMGDYRGRAGLHLLFRVVTCDVDTPDISLDSLRAQYGLADPTSSVGRAGFGHGMHTYSWLFIHV